MSDTDDLAAWRADRERRRVADLNVWVQMRDLIDEHTRAWGDDQARTDVRDKAVREIALARAQEGAWT